MPSVSNPENQAGSINCSKNKGVGSLVVEGYHARVKRFATLGIASVTSRPAAHRAERPLNVVWKPPLDSKTRAGMTRIPWSRGPV